MDDDQLRAVAATRPGYATYPDTRPGSPSWWRRPVDGAPPRRPALSPVARVMADIHPPTRPARQVPDRANCCADCTYWQLTPRQAFDYHGRICAYHGRRHDQWRAKADRLGRVAIGLWIATVTVLTALLAAQALSAASQ